MSHRYIIVTPVRDEEQYLGATIASVAGQVERPKVWVLVDDGSTDRTPEILAAAAKEHDWIRVHKMPPRKERILGAGVVQAFKSGLATVDLSDIEFISKLDADLELDPLYFTRLMGYMDQQPRLAIASGQAWVRDEQGIEYYERGAEEMPIGQAKLYRRAALDDIGGLVEKLAWDGIDSHEARVRGWVARVFPDRELRVITLRPEGASDRSVLRGRRRRGRGQWILGGDPFFFVASALLRMRDTPAVLGSINTIFGYFAAALTGVERHGSPYYGTQVRRFQRESLFLGKRKATDRFEDRTAANWPGALRQRIALLVSQHPTLSHTFIDTEIQGLRDHGWEVQPISLRAGDQVHPDAADVTTLRALPASRAAHHAAAALRHPWAVLSTCREAFFSNGARPRPIGAAYLWQAVLLLGELRASEIQHVHVHFANNAAEIARLAAHLSERDAVGAPLTYSLSIHGLSMHGATASEADTFPQANESRWGPLKAKVTTASFVRCVDARSARRVAQATGRSDVAVVHVGINASYYDGANPTRRGGDGPLTIGFVGRLSPEKQVPLLIRAFAGMAHPRRRLLIVGAGPTENECRALVSELGVESLVAFLGAMPKDRVRDTLLSFDILAMSSSYEGTPMVLMEAMAAGAAVVAPRVGGIPEVIDDEVTGLLVEPNDPSSLTAALDRLARDPGLRDYLGVNGRAHIVSSFNAENLAEELDRLLASTVGRRRLLPAKESIYR